LCDRLLGSLVPDGAPTDDVALLALRMIPMSERLDAEFATDPEALAPMRALLRRWLRHAGASDSETAEIVAACGEAAKNAVEHSGSSGRDPLELSGRFEGRTVDLSVRDHGVWHPPRAGRGGRGLPLMRALMDEVDVTSSPEGTTVRLSRTLG